MLIKNEDLTYISSIPLTVTSLNIRDIALDETVFKNKEAKMSNQSYIFKITLMGSGMANIQH